MPLGLQMTTVGALGGPNTMGDPGGTAVIEDYYWEIHTTAGAGNLTPLLKGSVIASIHDTWDLAGGEPNYQPKESGVMSEEGYWELHEVLPVIRPLDV